MYHESDETDESEKKAQGGVKATRKQKQTALLRKAVPAGHRATSTSKSMMQDEFPVHFKQYNTYSGLREIHMQP